MCAASSATSYDRLVELVYDAVFDDSAWLPMAATLEAVLAVSGSHLGLVDGARTDPRLVFSRLYIDGTPAPDLEELYAGEYFRIDERMPRFRALPFGEPVHNRCIYTADEMRRTSATYNDFLLRHGGANQLVVRLPNSGSDHDAWVLTRGGPRDYDIDDVELVRRVAQHVGRLVRMRRELSTLEAIGFAFTELLDSAIGAGVFLLDGVGRIVECNAQARVLAGPDGSLSVRDGQLGAMLPSADRSVREAIRRATGALGARQASSIRIPATERSLGLWMHVSPVSRRIAEPLSDCIEAIAVVRSPWSASALDHGSIRDALGLTAIEAEVAVLLAEGRTVRDIAKLRQRTVESVRWHLKQVYAKTGLRRQADLVRVVLTAGRVGSAISSQQRAT